LDKIEFNSFKNYDNLFIYKNKNKNLVKLLLKTIHLMILIKLKKINKWSILFLQLIIKNIFF